MRLNIHLILFFFLFSVFSKVQSQWNTLYNSPYSNSSSSSAISLDKNGNIFVSGTLWTGSITKDNYLIIKYNSSGDTLWTRQYDGFNEEDEIHASAIDKDGNLLVTGGSEEPGNYDICTIKYSPSGNMLWNQRYNGPGNGNDQTTGIVTDDSANVYVTGFAELNPYESRSCTIKYNSAGVQQWLVLYGGISVGSTTPTGIEFNNSTGSLYITGYISPSGVPAYAYALKFNRNGILMWTGFYGVYGNISSGYALAVDRNDNCFMTGYTTNSGNNKDFLTIKYNPVGDTQWVRTYASSNNGDDIARSIALDSIGNCYVTGKSLINTGSVSTEIVTVSYSATGTQRWIQHYNKNSSCCDHIPLAVTSEINGNILVSGQSTGDNNYPDYLVLNYSSSGVQQWVQRFHFAGSNNDIPSAMAIDSSGNIILTGTAAFSYLEIGTVKFLTSLTSINKNSNNIPDKIYLYQNYPNPFNPTTIINYQLPKTSDVKLVVYDVMGREVRTLVNERENTGTYHVEFDGSNLASGIFYTIKAGEFTETKKMLMLK